MPTPQHVRIEVVDCLPTVHGQTRRMERGGDGCGRRYPGTQPPRREMPYIQPECRDGMDGACADAVASMIRELIMQFTDFLRFLPSKDFVNKVMDDFRAQVSGLSVKDDSDQRKVRLNRIIRCS